MEINDKKFNRTKRVIYSLISIVLAVLLISLSYNIMSDIDSAVNEPNYNSYFTPDDKEKFSRVDANLEAKANHLLESSSNLSMVIKKSKEEKESEQASFENWNKARKSLNGAGQDQEVLRRLKRIDELQIIVQEWEAKSDSLYQELSLVRQEQELNNDQQRKAEDSAQSLYYSDYQIYNLKVFGVRLLFATPILALGIFFFVKKRKSKYSPLYMGFSIFAVYVFFFGLVPYLPSFGGYIRYTVGILLTIGLGYYAIKQLLLYQERRKNELKQSNTERALKMHSETATKSFENHVCPSCGKNFLLMGWEVFDSNTSIISSRPATPSNYCRYCGLQITKKCDNCNQSNYAHLPYCVNCGKKL